MKLNSIFSKAAKALCLAGVLAMACGCNNNFTYPPVMFPESPQQAGDGSKQSPYSVAGALHVITNYEIPPHKVYVSGVVTEITELDPSYGNATYIIGDPDNPASTLTVYRGYGLGGDKFASTDDLKVGDKVIVYGTLIYFKDNTPEFEQGSYLYKINDQVVPGDDPDELEGRDEPSGDGTEASPYNVARALEIIESGDMPSQEVYVKGVVKRKPNIEIAYGNATYYIKDAGWSDELYVYRGKWIGGAKFTSEDQLKAGDAVVVRGTLMNYNGKSPQLGQNNQLVSVN